MNVSSQRRSEILDALRRGTVPRAGLDTLALRMERHQSNAAKVAEFLLTHPKEKWVNYPGLATNANHAGAAKYFRKGAGFGGGLSWGVAALKWWGGASPSA